jgi:hypothetical protein
MPAFSRKNANGAPGEKCGKIYAVEACRAFSCFWATFCSNSVIGRSFCSLHRARRAYPAPATLNEINATVNSLALDDQRTEAILREHISISDAQWANLADHEFFLSAENSIKSGIATQMGDFSAPLGTPIYNI